MSDDSDDTSNGHSSRPVLVTVDDERTTGLERRLGMLTHEVSILRESMDTKTSRIIESQAFIEDFLRDINQKLLDILNNRDGWQVLKRLAAVEDAVAERPLPAPRKVSARKK